MRVSIEGVGMHAYIAKCLTSVFRVGDMNMHVFLSQMLRALAARLIPYLTHGIDRPVGEALGSGNGDHCTTPP